jgi:hypothetical protein
MPSGTSSMRRGSASAATSATPSAMAMNVRCVPISGMSTSVESHVPSSEPMVESA